jgi:hypothetical protein
MSGLDIRRQPPTSGKPVYKHEYERTAFDYTIIVFAYVFAPVGFILAAIRLLTTHSKRQRKASNVNLFYHVFMGAFVEFLIYFMISKLLGQIDYVELLIGLAIIYCIFRIPAIKCLARAKGWREGFTYLCNDFIALVLVDGIRHIGSLSDIRGFNEEYVRSILEYLKDQGLLSPDIVYYEGRVDNPFVKFPPKLVYSERTQTLVRAPENIHSYRNKRDRTVFDRIIMAVGYLFAPLGLVLVLLRFVTTHYKNERKSINFKLLYHVFMGAFMELAVLFAVMTYKGDFKWLTLLIILAVLYVIFVIPAEIFADKAKLAKESFGFLCNKYLLLIIADKVGHIGNIADIVKESEDDVRRDLQYLLRWGLLASDIVYYEGRVKLFDKQPSNLVHPNRAQTSGASQNQQSSERQSLQENQPKPPTQLPKSIVCSSCGAKSRVLPGQDKICDYCGTTIPYS